MESKMELGEEVNLEKYSLKGLWISEMIVCK